MGSQHTITSMLGLALEVGALCTMLCSDLTCPPVPCPFLHWQSVFLRFPPAYSGRLLAQHTITSMLGLAVTVVVTAAPIAQGRWLGATHCSLPAAHARREGREGRWVVGYHAGQRDGVRECRLAAVWMLLLCSYGHCDCRPSRRPVESPESQALVALPTQGRAGSSEQD